MAGSQNRQQIVRIGMCIMMIIFSSAGCGPAQIPTYKVSGIVRFSDGKPVRTGTVELESAEHGTTSSGSIRPDGTFVLGTYTSDDGAPAGEHSAIVAQFIMNDGMIRHSLDHGAPVDPLYASYQTSPLRITIAPRDNSDVEIVVEPARRNLRKPN